MTANAAPWTEWIAAEPGTEQQSPYWRWREFRDKVAPGRLDNSLFRARRQAFENFDQVMQQAETLGADWVMSDATRRDIDAGFPNAAQMPEGWLPPVESLPTVAADTVIVGIIDTGIALGHRRFRTKTGESRVLGSWQMNPGATQAVGGVPYGRALMKEEIERHLSLCSGGTLLGPLDEAAFNAAAGLTDAVDKNGLRDLMGRYAHGTATLDLAAGCDPQDSDAFSQRVKIIAVTLPRRLVFGLAGELLDLFMLHAVQWIVDLSDAIWKKSFPTAPAGGVMGFPVAINLSFGKQAGAKLGHLDLFPHILQQLRADRAQTAKAAKMAVASVLDIVMPAGNDNLAQAHAALNFAPGQPAQLDWRISPSDQSDNFVEIWIEGAAGDVTDPWPVSIALVPPGGTPSGLPGRPGYHRDMSNVARIECIAPSPWQKQPDQPEKARLAFGFILCVAATELPETPDACAPSGLWSITLQHDGPAGSAPFRAHFFVQSDQGVLPQSKSARRSRFEHPTYRRFDEMGRPLDSLTCANRAWRDNDDPDGIRRHGTLNATAANSEVLCIGGYRASDGVPAPYSATGRGKDATGRGAPTVSLPTDDAPAHLGLIVAGASDGSAVVMQGTSFATAMATRLVAEHHIGGVPTETSGQFLRNRAIACEATDPFPAVPHSLASGNLSALAKLGAGRINRRPVRKIGRL